VRNQRLRTRTSDHHFRRDDGTLIYNEPAEFDESECEACGRTDRLAGVSWINAPYVAGLPLYVWERDYWDQQTQEKS
jgi:hypothetical protein